MKKRCAGKRAVSHNYLLNGIKKLRWNKTDTSFSDLDINNAVFQLIAKQHVKYIFITLFLS
jgi:hypothetical protein